LPYQKKEKQKSDEKKVYGRNSLEDADNIFFNDCGDKL
jgi:hypothetical protein